MRRVSTAARLLLGFVFGVQVACGLLLLVNRFVGFAVVTLAAVIANVIAFHVTMWPDALLPMPIVVLVLWFLTALPLRRPLAAAMRAHAGKGHAERPR